MPNITRTVCDTGGIFKPGSKSEFRDETLNLAGADDLLEGTILARDSVSLKLVLYVKAGSTNQNNIPKAVLPYAASFAGGDVRVRVAIKGEFIKERLVIDLDQNDSNIDGLVIDQLRAVGLTAVNAQQLAALDP